MDGARAVIVRRAKVFYLLDVPRNILEPGIYAFHGPGDGELLYPVQAPSSNVRMWGVGRPVA